MKKWFECTVQYKKVNNEGKLESMSELYFINAVNITEAESKMNAMVKANEVYNDTTFDYRVSSVSETKIMDVYPYETMGEREVSND